MDPITTAIIAALAAGVTSGITETAKNTIVDAYNALKSLLKKKLGDQSRVAKSIDLLESMPDSNASKAAVQEALLASKVDQDPDILQAAQALLNRIKAQPGGEHHIQTATGTNIAQSDRGSTSTVNVNYLKEP